MCVCWCYDAAVPPVLVAVHATIAALTNHNNALHNTTTTTALSQACTDKGQQTVLRGNGSHTRARGTLHCIRVTTPDITTSNNQRGPLLTQQLGVLSFLLFLYIFIGDLAWLVITHTTDPGMLPKQVPPGQESELKENRDRYYDTDPPKKEINVNGKMVTLRWCGKADSAHHISSNHRFQVWIVSTSCKISQIAPRRKEHSSLHEIQCLKNISGQISTNIFRIADMDQLQFELVPGIV